jgi:hypothetical protein
MKTEDIRSISGADAMRHCDGLIGRGEGYLTAGDLPDDTAEALRALAQDTFVASHSQSATRSVGSSVGT